MIEEGFKLYYLGVRIQFLNPNTDCEEVNLKCCNKKEAHIQSNMLS